MTATRRPANTNEGTPSGQGRSPIWTQPPVATQYIYNRHAQPTSRGAPCLDFPPGGLCWRIHIGDGAGRSLVRRVAQLPPSGVPVSQASTRTRLRARAVSTCCRWVLGRPR
jgi:hypothetical protein